MQNDRSIDNETSDDDIGISNAPVVEKVFDSFGPKKKRLFGRKHIYELSPFQNLLSSPVGRRGPPSGMLA